MATNKIVDKTYLTRQFANYNAGIVVPKFKELSDAADSKVSKREGYDLSKNDFNDDYKTKLEGLENYDDTEANSDIDDNAAAIEIINGESTVTGSVAKKVDDRITALIAGADTDYDTLGEISSWISGHASDAKDMEDAIKANADDIKAIQDQQAEYAYELETEDLDFSGINSTEEPSS